MYNLTYPQAIFCAIYWFLFFVIYSFALKKNVKFAYGKGYFFLWLIITVYSTFEFNGGDFYYYKEIYDQVLHYNSSIHMESFYIWVLKSLPQNYFLWRFVIWGLASFFWIQIAKDLKLDARLYAILFFLIIFFLFVGARQSLGFSILYLGLIFLLKHDNKKWKRALGLMIMVVSCFFHKTMFIYLIISLVSIVNFGKNYIIALLILFPIFYKGMDLFIEPISLLVSDDIGINAIQRYLNSDFRSEANIYGIIRKIIDRLPVFLLIIYAIKNIFFNNEKVDYLQKVLLRVSFILIYVSYLFAGKEVSAFIPPRFWDAALFPFTIFLSLYLFNHTHQKNRLVNLSLVLFVLSKLFTIAYRIYKIN